MVAGVLKQVIGRRMPLEVELGRLRPNAMLKILPLCVAGCLCLGFCETAPAGDQLRTMAFDGNATLADWSITGNVSVSQGGSAETVPPPGEANPYDEKAVAAAMAARRPVVIFTKDNAPATPQLEDLPQKERVSQFGITWTFAQPARVRQFVNGDWYVVGPVTIKRRPETASRRRFRGDS